MPGMPGSIPSLDDSLGGGGGGWGGVFTFFLWRNLNFIVVVF